jgi:hypothetical protein
MSSALAAFAKKSLADHTMALPEGVAEVSDFEAWGKRFVTLFVRCLLSFLSSLH